MACCTTINNSEVGVLENCGRYSRLSPAGCVCLLFPCEYVAGRVSLRVQELCVEVETKTKEYARVALEINVFVILKVSVQYTAVREKIFAAFYKLSNVQEQMKSYVFDVVRSTIPGMTLDQAFESKEDIAMSVRTQLSHVMDEYGYAIMQSLVTDLTPDSHVRDAMNEINASKRLKEAALAKAEAGKISLVKAAEADAESKYLSGVGVARQRKALVDGLRDSIVEFSHGVNGTTPKDVMDLLLLTQYFDMLKDIGANPHTQTILVPSGPINLSDQIRDGLLQGTVTK